MDTHRTQQSKFSRRFDIQWGSLHRPLGELPPLSSHRTAHKTVPRLPCSSWRRRLENRQRAEPALHQNWKFMSDSFATNAIGTLTIDATDPVTHSMPGLASPMRRLIRKLVSEFTKQPMAGTRGRISPRTPMFRLEQVLTALAPLGLAAFKRPPHTAVRLSTDVPSPRSLSIQTIRAPFTLAPPAQCAGLAPFQVAAL